MSAEDKSYGNALTAAPFGGHKGMIRFLLMKGADVNAEAASNALTAAPSHGHDVANAETRCYSNVLTIAPYHGHEGVVRLILETGCRCECIQQALREASINHHVIIARKQSRCQLVIS